ncbi:MAG: hypothetical protein P4L98_04535 [Ancalomicrobiaceae bacterium]|nr:hypothetical protein [Ancalomicrobiaceae bacterium]
MDWNEKACPVWETPAITYRADLSNFLSDSVRMGGRYMITDRAFDVLKAADPRLKAKLTTWAIRQREQGAPCPIINTEIVELVASARPRSVVERSESYLMFIESQTSYIGEKISSFAGRLESLSYTESANIDEIAYLSRVLEQKGWVFSSETFLTGERILELTIDGYIHLDELRTRQTLSSQAFVAMWFDASMTDAYDNGLKPGIEDAGYSAVRIDAVAHNNKIDDAIIAEIRRSRFLVADFSHGEGGPRGGVYYEAGFAHGLNIPVIFTCRQDMIDKVHFDTRQYNHITWKEPAELRQKLANRISATIGDGPNRKAP